MKKKVLFLLAIFVVIASLSAFSSAKAEEFAGPTEANKAPTEIKVGLVPNSAALSGCITPCNAIMEIAPRYGWETQIFDGRGNPADQNKAILDAISWGADVIAVVSGDPLVLQQGLAAAYAAGIPIISGSNGTDDPNPKPDLDEGQFDYLYDVAPGYFNLGKKMADWMAADSGGDGVVKFFDCPGVSSVALFLEGMQEQFTQHPDMKIDPEVTNFTFDQLGEALDRIVLGYVQTHPDVEYIYMPWDGSALTVIEALDTAGYTDVKVVSVLGTSDFISLIRRGTPAAATAAYDSYYMGYAMADQFIRVLNNKDLFSPHDENLPLQIIDKTNLPAEGSDWVPDYDYKEAFYKLWD